MVERTFAPRPFKKPLAEVPRHWFGGNAVATQLVNAINLLFPEGERFFVRAVRRYEKQIDDPELRAQIRHFYAQEARHAHAHERYFDTMRAHGYDLDGILAWTERILRNKKLISPAMALSVTVALEHYTAVMAELAYTDPFFERIEPTMRELLLWHAAEEIEHKAVAFDVMKRVHPSYALRIGGFAVASAGLAALWAIGTVILLRRDRLPLSKIVADAREVLGNGILGEKIFFRALKRYLARDFHPMQQPDDPRVAEFLATFEAELARAA